MRGHPKGLMAPFFDNKRHRISRPDPGWRIQGREQEVDIEHLIFLLSPPLKFRFLTKDLKIYLKSLGISWAHVCLL